MFSVYTSSSNASSMEEHIERLIVNHLSGQASQEEEERLQEWLGQQPSHRAAFEEYRQLWTLTNHPIAIDPQTENGWQAFARQAFDKAKPVPLPGKTLAARPRYFRLPAYGIAAGVVLLLLFVALRYTRPGNSLLATFTQREIKSDSLRRLALPDGTVVWLNRHSTLRHPRTFAGDHREVYLEGEAFFEVRKDSVRPFRILAGHAVTEVLGTSFNVRAYPGEPTVQVVVATGKVRLGGERQTGQEAELTAGWTGTYQIATARTSWLRRTDPNYLSWKTGKLVFENTPLGEVLPALHRHYGIPVSLQDSGLSSRRITTAFNQQPLEEVLDEIGLLLDLQHHRQGETIIFTAQTP